jgi:hypothetical protein
MELKLMEKSGNPAVDVIRSLGLLLSKSADEAAALIEKAHQEVFVKSTADTGFSVARSTSGRQIQSLEVHQREPRTYVDDSPLSEPSKFDFYSKNQRISETVTIVVSTSLKVSLSNSTSLNDRLTGKPSPAYLAPSLRRKREASTLNRMAQLLNKKHGGSLNRKITSTNTQVALERKAA